MILVWLNAAPEVAVGDTVTVLGTTSVYNKGAQFGTDSVVTKTGTATVEHGTATALTADDLTAYKSATSITPIYVELTGKLSVSGNYFNVIVDGTDAQGSLTYLAGDLKDAATALNGWTIKATGYVTSLSGGKYVNLMVTSVEAVSLDVTVYYKNTLGWDTVSVYSWIWTEATGTNTEYAGTWPGTAATNVEGTDWWSLTYTVTSLDGLKVIFNNNNNGSQTTDLTFDVAATYWYNGKAYATKAAADEAYEADLAANIQYSDWYVRGSMDPNWNALPEYRLQLDADGNAWIEVELAADTQFKIADAGWSKQFNMYNVTDTTNFTWGDGENIKVVNAGTYKFVVSADGSTLTITPVEEAPVQTTITMKHSQTTTTSLTEDKANNATLLGLDSTIFAVEYVLNDCTAPVGLNKNGDFRIYSKRDTGNGEALVVTASTGKIVSIKITLNSDNQTESFVVSAGDTAVTAVDGVYTINAASFSIQNVYTGTDSNKQVRIASIEIVYEAE